MFNGINIRDLKTDLFRDLLEGVPCDGVPRGKRDLRKLIDSQGSCLLISRTVHPNEQEVQQKYQEACMDEQAAPGNA